MKQNQIPPADVTLAILAGGEGSRMGMPKGELRVGGEPILQYLLRRFKWPSTTLLVTAPGREHPSGWESFDREVADPIGGLGPLRGVLTALEHATTEHVLVTLVDMPGIGEDQLSWLASAFAAERQRGSDPIGMMTCRGGTGTSDRVEPFPAVFHRDAAPKVRERLETGHRSVHALAHASGFLVVPAPVGWGESAWINLNSPADMHAFLAPASAKPPSKVDFAATPRGENL